MEVLSVASEVYPLVKTGGLADVAGALPGALVKHGVRMRTLVPGYRRVIDGLDEFVEAAHIPDLFGGPARLLAGHGAGIEILAIDAPHLYDRDGGPYVDERGQDWPDNWQRFAALSFMAAEIARGLISGYYPQIVHCHDWQAGLAPAYLRFGGFAAKSVMTVHNLAFLGWYERGVFPALRLPGEAFSINGVEFYNGVSYLKSGLACADAITTVSPTYASEIRTLGQGMGFEGLLNSRAADLHGILNGIDTSVWDPAHDGALTRTYRAGSVHHKAPNKAALAQRFELEQGDGPLFAVVSRLTQQKGMDMLLDVLEGLVALGGRLVVLGSGERGLEDGFRRATERFAGKVGLFTGYDESLSHLVQGGADAILVPSRFEPCGLTQLIGLRYGTVPVVARVGGLADTVIDANPAALAADAATGIVFSPVTAHQLYEAIRRTVALYQDEKEWRRLQRRAMRADVSWDASALHYVELYKSLIGH